MADPTAAEAMTENQRQCAADAGISVADDLDLAGLITRLEAHLGDRAVLECARWFVLSVARHRQGADWRTPAQSSLSTARQYELAARCLALPGFGKSLRSVLRDDRFKYTLIDFGRTRNAARRTLANTTTAFRQVDRLLQDIAPEAIPDQKPGVAAAREATPATPAVGTAAPAVTGTPAAARRARRRGLGRHGTVRVRPPSTTGAAVTPAMSRQEYTELEEALAGRPATGPRPQGSFGSEGRRSWVLGVLAGLSVFLLWLLVA